MNYTPIYYAPLLPSNLLDVIARLANGEEVYGFELELLADCVSR